MDSRLIVACDDTDADDCKPWYEHPKIANALEQKTTCSQQQALRQIDWVPGHRKRTASDRRT
jgi:hypothetical protein